MDRAKNHEQDKVRMVNEGDSCSHWELCDRGNIAPLKECWFCKWADFTMDDIQHQSQSACRYQEKENG